jgi:hypothetical protein
MKLTTIFPLTGLLGSALLAQSALASMVPADLANLATSHEVSAPAAVTSGCAASDYCTLTELLAGASITGGGLSFGNFALDFADGYGGESGLDTDHIWVRLYEYSGALLLDYDFAPLGFGGPLPSLLAGETSGFLDLSYSVVSDGSVGVVGAWLYDMAAAGTSNADYELMTEMMLYDGSDEIDSLYSWLNIVNNSVIEADAYDFALFNPLLALSVGNALSQISYEGLNTFYYIDQVFFTEENQVPAPLGLGLFAIGLGAMALRKRRS